jgi:hypothetical protein
MSLGRLIVNLSEVLLWFCAVPPGKWRDVAALLTTEGRWRPRVG